MDLRDIDGYKGRMDLVKVDGDEYIVKYESSSTPGKIDAKVLERSSSDRAFLDNPRENGNLGESYSVPLEVLEDSTETIEYMEKELSGSEEEEDQEDPFDMGDIDAL